MGAKNEEPPPGSESNAPGDEARPESEEARRQAPSATKGTKKAKAKRATKKKATDGESSEPKAKAAKKKAAKKKATKKKAAKKTSTRRKKLSLGQLPPKSMLLTDSQGNVAGVLPKEALVLVNRGIIFDPAGTAIAVDPRSTERAFLWLIGRRQGQGLDPTIPHQRLALRVAEQLVRASVVGDVAGCALVTRLYGEMARDRPSGASAAQAKDRPVGAADGRQSDADRKPSSGTEPAEERVAPAEDATSAPED